MIFSSPKDLYLFSGLYGVQRYVLEVITQILLYLHSMLFLNKPIQGQVVIGIYQTDCLKSFFVL